MSAEQRDLLNPIGKRLGQYEVLEEIGRGGMAVVYKGYQPSLNRYVAIKVLLPHLSQDPELLQRFGREARAAAMLQHHNIIRIFDVGEEGGVHYLVMDYLPSPSLATRLKREGALDSRVALAILRDVAAALDHAHARGVIHRDVKPSNILFAADGRGILSDFGIAKPVAASRLTQTGTAIGTPAYMSPEQVQGQTLDGRSDLYALGIVLYEMLTGRVPFHADTPVAILYKHVHESPPAPSQANPAISAQVDRVVLHALQKDRNRRYATPGEMVQDFARAVSGGAEPTGATLRGMPHQKGRATEQFAPGTPAIGVRPTTSPGGRSTSVPAPLMAAIVSLAIIATVWLLFVRSPGGGTTLPTLALPTKIAQVANISAATATPRMPTAILSSTFTPTSKISPTLRPTQVRSPSPTRTRSPTLTRTVSPSPIISPTPIATPYARVITGTDRLNVRSGPGENYDVLTKAYDGDLLALLGRDRPGEWLKVRVSDGTEGWASTKWVQASVSVGSLPVLPVPPTPEKPRIDPRFRADQMTIKRGECTTLRWEVDDVREVHRDDRPVSGHGSELVCPTSTQTFTLVVDQLDGQRILWPVTISVSGDVESFELVHRGCIQHSLTGVGQVKGQVFDKNGNIITNAAVEITVDGQSVVPPGRTNEQGWYKWNLTPGQVARFVRLTVGGRVVSFTHPNFEVTATSGCYQRVDFHQR